MQARLRRDRAPAPRPSRGVTVWWRAQSSHRRYPQRPGSFPFDKMVEYSGAWRMGAYWSVLARMLVLLKKPLKHPCVKNHRTRPLCRIGTNPAILDTSVLCYARSDTRLDLRVTRIHLHNLGAISLYLAILTVSRDSEIAPRLYR